MDPLLDIEVFGAAEPAGSKKATAVYRKGADGRPVPVLKDGRVVVSVRDDNDRSKGWKERVAQAVGERWAGGLLEGALVLELTFYRPRNKGDWGSGRNRDVVRGAAPAHPAVRPDVLKLARGVEDALTGIVWRDDAQIVEERLVKRFGEPARVRVRLWEAQAQRAADLPLAERVRPGAPLLGQESLAA